MTERFHQPVVLKLAEVRDEAEDIRTFFFDHPLQAAPGQFMMLWLPGVDLKPFGIAYLSADRFGLTVAKVGPYTEKLFAVTAGGYLGVVGPYGTTFNTGTAKRIVLVGGGYGSATVAPLADAAASAGTAVDFIVGARTAQRLLYQGRYQKNAAVRFHAVTDDGSAGTKGRTTDVLQKLIAEGDVAYIAACGPEKMLHAIAEMAVEAKIPCEVSIERYMKCGFGVCGACCMDTTGERVCVEGTVMSAEHALTLTEFGAYHRARSGRKMPL
ncbi:MAG: dihydroorotate dehydrogenase electron transfer subunit [Candidatus Kerfeldbacteria bacterium]|nr:dihydroorotate dehydrogenase electron transfer subunit [Candidatus Kerfeldbacteria bacterium]